MDRGAEIDGAQLGAGAFAAGAALWVGRREIAHIDADGALDLRLTKAVIRRHRVEFDSDERTTLRAPGSDWLEIRVDRTADVDFALSLVEEAVRANLATATLGPPPSGAALERRRRFH
jgi:hypothetical protein